MFSVKIFDAEFYPDLYALKSPESIKVVLENWSARMCVCMCVYVTEREYSASPKLTKIEKKIIHSTRLVHKWYF